MKARNGQVLAALGLLSALAAGGSLNTIGAQQTQRTIRPDPNTPRFMIPPLCSAEKGLGGEAAEAIRAQMTKDYTYKVLWTIPKNDINGTLEASGYPTDQCLPSNDAKILAKQIRADEYLTGTVTRAGGRVTIAPYLVLSRDNTLTQPLPVASAGSVAAAAKQVSGSLGAARKQLPAEQKCLNLARESKWAEAVAAGRAGSAAYPKATLTRLCVANVYFQKNGPFAADSLVRADSVLKVANEVLAIDSTNRAALRLAADAYRIRKNDEQQINALTRLLATDPTNTALVDEVVSTLGKSGKAGSAVGIIKRALDEHPGDPSLTRTGFLIFLAAKDWKNAVATGQLLAQVDTAATDTMYFQRMAAAYATDSQPAKALEVIARGTAKFPNNANLWVIRSQLERQAGQTQQSLVSLRKATALNPKNASAILQVARAQMDMNQSDSALASLHLAAQSAADTSEKGLVARVAYAQGGTIYKQAQQSKNRADYEKAMQYLAFSNEVQPSGEASLLLAVSSFSVAQTALQEASGKGVPKARKCELTRTAEEGLSTAMTNLALAGKSNPDAAKQIAGGVQQLGPYVDRYKKAYKCGS